MSVVATVGPMTLSIGGEEVGDLTNTVFDEVRIDEAASLQDLRDLQRLSIKLKRLDVIQPLERSPFATLGSGMNSPWWGGRGNRHERRRQAALDRRL